MMNSRKLMAPLSSPSIAFLILLIFSSTVSIFTASGCTQCPPPLAKGLSWSFYDSTCPKVETVVRKYLKKAFENDIGLAAGLLRLHFHDCFVQGCDASVLLDGSASGPSEQASPPNLSLRKSAFKAINDLRTLIDTACNHVVSCADIAAIAARDSVYLSGGPDYQVPLGRRDGLNFATGSATLASLPAPFSNATVLLASFAKLGFDAVDLVALSGGHTIGLGHCSSFSNRLFPSQDPVMDKSFAKKLYLTCPAANTANTTALDVRSPTKFDNRYYVDLMNRQGLFTSDQDLYSDRQTREAVTTFAVNQSLFFNKFEAAMVKMGQLGVLTGLQGEIRANCSARNTGSGMDGGGLWSVVDGETEGKIAS